MKAFLLAAGHGTRLWPLTQDVPKCLVRVQGRPILDIWLDICRRFKITDLLVNTHAHADKVQDHVTRTASGLNVVVSEEKQLLGSAGTLRANREWVKGEQDFWVLYCDVLTNMNLSKMLSYHRRNGGHATIGVYTVHDPCRCGIVRTDAFGRVVEFQEKPKRPRSNLAFSGIMLMKPAVLDTIPDGNPTPDIAFDILPKLVGKMHAYPVHEFLVDIGTRETYNQVQKEWPGLSTQRFKAA